MRTWSTLLLVAAINASAQPPQIQWQDGVMVQTVGKSIIYIFPATQGRIVAVENPAGQISIGDSITIAYALKIVRLGKSRFVGLDASKLESVGDLRAHLSVKEKAPKDFGFLIRDTKVGTLDMHMSPSFMQEKAVAGANTAQEKVARQGNLTVVIGQVNGRLKILSASLD